MDLIELHARIEAVNALMAGAKAARESERAGVPPGDASAANEQVRQLGRQLDDLHYQRRRLERL